MSIPETLKCRGCGTGLVDEGVDWCCPNPDCTFEADLSKAFLAGWREDRERAEYERLKAKFGNRPTITPADQAETLEACPVEQARWLIFDHISKLYRTDETKARELDTALDRLVGARNGPTITPVDYGRIHTDGSRSGGQPVTPAAGEEGDEVLDALLEAKNTFFRYGRLHRAKGTAEGNEKAAANDALGDKMGEGIIALARYRLANRSAEVERLRAALEPFARFGAMWLGSPTEVILRGVDRSELTIADLRRARAALTGQPVTKETSDV